MPSTQNDGTAIALFSMMFSAMLTVAFNSDDPEISIRNRTDAKLFNVRRLNYVSKVDIIFTRDLLFAYGAP